MANAAVKMRCPSCGDNKVVKFGRTRTGGQRYCCRNADCRLDTFKFDYTYKRCQRRVDEINEPPGLKILGVRPLDI